MGKKIIVALALWTLFRNLSLAQPPSDIRERLFVQVNSPTLLAGDKLCFSAFNVSDRTGKLHELSKFLYVELIGSNGRVFQQQVPLKKGMGHGAFFIHSLLSTGRYQLVAYTRWMKNFGDVFQLPITIVNPFEEYKSVDAQQKPQISWYIPDTTLVAGVENRIGLSALDVKGLPFDFTAKVIDGDGQFVSDFPSGKNGSSTLLFTPKADTDYRILIEDDKEEFYFLDLPRPVATGYTLRVSEESEHYQVAIKGNVKNNAPLDLRLFSMQDEVLSQQVGQNTTILVLKDTLPYGPCHLKLYAGDVPMASAVLLHRRSRISTMGKEQKAYSKRSPVRMEVSVPKGHYSISVRKSRAHLKEPQHHAVDNDIYFNLVPPYTAGAKALYLEAEGSPGDLNDFKKPRLLGTSVPYLPEYRGALLSGTAWTPEGAPWAKQWVAFAIPGKVFQVRAVRTDEKGRFLYHYLPPMGPTKAYMTAVDTQQQLHFELEDAFLEKAPAFDYTAPTFDSLQIQELVAISIRNQIENAYFRAPVQDSLDAAYYHDWSPQFPNFDYEYHLDDYTRFPTFAESIVEYMQGLRVKKGEATVIMSTKPALTRPQLILLDGVPVDAERILSYNPLKIKSAGITVNRVFLGPAVFDGLLSLQTYEGQLEGYSPPNATVFDMDGASKGEAAPSNTGRSAEDSRPDKREQLYWEPSRRSQGDPLTIDFSTSDVRGRFLLRIEGFTDKGEAVTVKREFIVE